MASTGGLAFLTPIAGGALADRWLGRTRTVATGAALITLGHLLMAFDTTFVLALLILLTGMGCYKSNAAAQVGALYVADDPNRPAAYQMLSIAVNGVGIVAPLVCGGLGEAVGWHVGFGVAGLAMLAALAVYLGGRRWMPPEPARLAKGASPRLTPAERRRVLALLLLLVPLVLVNLGNIQLFNAYVLWASAHLDLQAFGRALPVTWLLSLDGGVSVATMVGTLLFWRAWGRRRRSPSETTRIALGAGLAALAPLALAVGSWVAGAAGRVSLGWAALFHLLNDLGLANVIPVVPALVTRVAPPRVAGVLMALSFTIYFFGNLLAGWLGSKVDIMPAPWFWAIHAVLVGVGGLGVLLVRSVSGDALTSSRPPE